MTKQHKQTFKRLDDLPCSEWRPLTINEHRMLAPIKLIKGKVSVDRRLLALLLGERERLRLISEAARWVADAAVDSGILDRPDFLNPSDLERASSLLRDVLRSVDSDCAGLPFVEAESSACSACG